MSLGEPVGGGPPTAGSSGASTGGAGMSPDPTPGLPEAGEPVLPCTFALCESFEDVPVGSPPSSTLWQNVDDGIVVDSARAFRGSKSVHIPAFAGKGNYMMQTTKGLPLPGKSLFGRVFFWIENAPPFGQTYLHWALVNATGKNAAGNDMQHLFGGQAFEGKPGNYLSYNSWSPQGYSGPQKGYHPVGVPLKSWQCVEWSFDTTLSQAQFWWNGAELTEIAFQNPPGMTKFDFPEFRSVSIGWVEFHDSASPWEVWIDEIALGAERIRCDR